MNIEKRVYMNQGDDFQEFLHHLSDNALQSLRHADGIARATGSVYVGTEHLLLGVLAQENSLGAKLLADNGVTLEKARLALNLTVNKEGMLASMGSKGLSEAAKLTLKMSWEVAQEYAQETCGTEHIVYSILSQKNASATVLLNKMNVRVEDILSELEHLLSKQSYEADTDKKQRKKGKKTLLDTFSTDLTAQARAGKLDPVIGREVQIKRLVTILNRRTKNNPVLIGEPGVGKTAIVEGVAQRIVNDEVPDALVDKRIVILDLAAMIAGTKYRGEFEDRLKKVMKELEEDRSTIVFIDEIHQLVGAGSAEGSMDAGNILKPALARGRIQMIGATTTAEYTKYIEKDAALERRLQPIIVPETSDAETLAILRGLKKHYEDFHSVTISDEVINSALRAPRPRRNRAPVVRAGLCLPGFQVVRKDASSEIRFIRRDVAVIERRQRITAINRLFGSPAAFVAAASFVSCAIVFDALAEFRHPALRQRD